MPTMPKLPLATMTENLNKNETAIIAACFVKRTGLLRATKPYKTIDFADPKLPSPLFKASVNCVWRMMCFDFCDWAPHDCLPCTADWDVRYWYYRTYGIDYDHDTAQKTVDNLDKLVKRVEATLSITLQKGVLRWGEAYGLL